MISGPAAIPAPDGVPNIIRYALGAGPADPVVHLLPTLRQAGDGFGFRFKYDPAISDLRWKITSSGDLEDWSQVIFDSAVDPIPALEEGWLAIDVPFAAAPRGFARLELELAPD